MGLHSGDVLPSLNFEDATGKLVSVNSYFAGKVGVLLVAAHTCPVAFLGLASAAQVLQPWLTTDAVHVPAINPWDKPQMPKTAAMTLPFDVLCAPLTSTDYHDDSQILDGDLAQPAKWGPPMPLVCVVAADDHIVLAQWGWECGKISAAVKAALAQPWFKHR